MMEGEILQFIAWTMIIALAIWNRASIFLLIDRISSLEKRCAHGNDIHDSGDQSKGTMGRMHAADRAERIREFRDEVISRRRPRNAEKSGKDQE